jgi:hypothetical protein
MTRRTNNIRCALAAIALLAPSLTLAPFAASSAKEVIVQELVPDPDHCRDGRPGHGVYCSKNHNVGGPTGCFISQCQARQVGAYECFTIDSCD